MTKKEMTDAVIESLPEGGDAPVTKSARGIRLQTEVIMESLFGVMAAELLGGGEVILPKIGKLKVVPTKARTGRNPKTGEPLAIPAGRRVNITLYKDFKEALKP